jgi:hypothetical protein
MLVVDADECFAIYYFHHAKSRTCFILQINVNMIYITRFPNHRIFVAGHAVNSNFFPGDIFSQSEGAGAGVDGVVGGAVGVVDGTGAGAGAGVDGAAGGASSPLPQPATMRQPMSKSDTKKMVDFIFVTSFASSWG